MAIQSLSIYGVLDNLARFQAFWQPVVDALEAFGWVQDDDTGQTRPEDLVGLPAGNDLSTVVIFKPGDALTPFFLRLAMGRDGSSQPLCNINLGMATNGASALAGNLITNVGNQVIGASAQNNPMYLSGTSGRFGFCYNPAGGGDFGSFMHVIARKKAANGTDADGGATMWGRGANNFYPQQSIPFTGTVVAVRQTGWIAARPSPASGSWNTGVSTLVAFPVPVLPSGEANPQHECAIVHSSDFTANTTANLTVYGAEHTYLISGGSLGDPARAVMLYE